MIRLSEKEWKNVFRNLQEDSEPDSYDETWVSVVYLDPMTETDSKWGLVYGEELLEKGFNTEEEALKRLQYMEKKILGGIRTL